jgi:hypothetical protein
VFLKFCFFRNKEFSPRTSNDIIGNNAGKVDTSERIIRGVCFLKRPAGLMYYRREIRKHLAKAWRLEMKNRLGGTVGKLPIFWELCLVISLRLRHLS